MEEQRWEVIVEVPGELQAEMLRGLFEAQGIPVLLIQEGAGRAYGLNVGPMGQVQILTLENHTESARQLLAEYYAGELATEIDPEEPSE